MKGVKTILTAMAVMAFALPSWSLTVECEAGSLASRLAASAPAAQIEVKGTVDVRDLLCLAQTEGIREVDLSGATVEAFSSRVELLPGATRFKASEIPAYAFFGSGIEKMTLPRTLKVIGEGAFAASSLKELTAFEGLERIEADAFNGSALMKFIAPATVNHIGERAFSGALALHTVDLAGSKVTSLPTRAFAGCTSLYDFKAPAVLRTLGSEVFVGTAIQELSLNEVGESGAYALALMPKLRKADVSADAEGMFFGDVELVHIPSLPDNIDRYYLAGCEAMQDVLLAPGLVSVGAYAFSGMRNLIFVDGRKIKGAVPQADEDAFRGLDVSKIELCVDGNYRELWDAADVWKDFHITNDISECSIEGMQGYADMRLDVDANSVTVVCPQGVDAMAVYTVDGILMGAAAGPAESLGVTLPDTSRGSLLIVEAVSKGITKSFRIIF